jgi:hypothetical protein
MSSGPLLLRQAGGGPFHEGNPGDVLRCIDGKRWQPGSAASLVNIVDGTNVDAWSIVQGDPAELIASVSITVAENSRLLIWAMTGFQCTVAAGRFFISCPDLASNIGSQSADAGAGVDFRTLNVFGLSVPLVAGPHLVELFMNVAGAVGAKADSFNANVLVVQEVLAA